MTSTSHKPQPTQPDQVHDIERVLRPILQLPIIRQFCDRSIGTRLFVSVMTGALVGIGGVAFLFGEIVKYQAESEIQQTVNDKAATLEGILGQAETLAETFRTSILTLYQQKTETPENYRNLTFELFKKRPDFLVGLGFGQSENGLLPAKQWYFSYYFLDSDNPSATEQTNQTIRYSGGTEPDNFYPETDRYQNYFLPQKDVWSSSVVDGDRIQSTYYSQIIDSQNQWLGTVFVDLDSTSLHPVLSDSVINQSGFFALLTAEGQIISYPTAPDSERLADNYQSIPGLATVWSEIAKGESGLVEGDRGYWSYARMPGSNWITVGFVPYRAVFSRVALITAGGAITVGVLMAIVVALIVRYLNHRFRPLLQECNRLAAADSETQTLLEHQDEIGQISISFFNMLEQLKTNQEQIRQEVARTVEAEAQLKQAESNELEGKIVRSELTQLLNAMAAMEQGDLAGAARPSSQLTEDVAEILNRLIERFAKVIAIVLSAAESVDQGAADLEQFAIDVAHNVQQQTQSAAKIQTLIENTNKLSQDAALQAVATSEAVQVAQAAIYQGQQGITDMSQGITVLEQDTNQIIKRTQTLTNYVELATQFAKDQKRIAAMTRILAVNASMLASRASAQQDPEQLVVITREFETIAGQVNTLASQTNQSLVLLQQRTDQIQTVVSGLNYDVQEISQQVGTFTSSVDQSRKAFDTIKTLNEQVAYMGQHVIQSNQTITDAAQMVFEFIQEISAIASNTLDQVDTTKQQAQTMGQLAHTLLHHVKFFQLPTEKTKAKDEA